MSRLNVDKLTGATGTASGAPITLSGDTVTLGSSVTVPASIGGSEILLNTHTADGTSATLEVDLTQYTTFDTYKFRFVDWIPASDDKNFYMRVGTSSSSVTTGYRTAGPQGYYNGSSGNVSYFTSGDYIIWAGAIGSQAHEGLCAEGFVYSARNSSKSTRVTAHINLFDKDNYVRYFANSGMSLSQQDDAYFKFFWESDVNTTSGKFYFYGVKNA